MSTVSNIAVRTVQSTVNIIAQSTIVQCEEHNGGAPLKLIEHLKLLHIIVILLHKAQFKHRAEWWSWSAPRTYCTLHNAHIAMYNVQCKEQSGVGGAPLKLIAHATLLHIIVKIISHYCKILHKANSRVV